MPTPDRLALGNYSYNPTATILVTSDTPVSSSALGSGLYDPPQSASPASVQVSMAVQLSHSALSTHYLKGGFSPVYTALHPAYTLVYDLHTLT